ncbi:efflux RND transporter periplasmic adaptor subunit [Devosia sp.]|uniref:efflux RND transporter periplasmic adaptor subunit n=1 Tax=Devosia sp. TaxID=1871048 RepID=UPI002FCCB824
MIRQLVASLIVLAAASAAWIFFVPGSTETLARVGIVLPFAAAPEQQAQPGRRPGGFGGRQTNVVTTAVTLSTINDTLAAVGEGTAASSVTVTSPAGGTLAEVLVRPGQVVAAGDVIARLDAEAEQIAYDRARLAVDDAQATLARTEGLASSSVVATTALTAAQLAAANADLELRNAGVALARRTIASPIAGTVGLIRVTPGNYVAAQTTVTTVDDTSSILVDFWVPERYAGVIALGAPVTISSVALSGRSFAGEVSAIDNRIDPASRTLQVQAQIPNEDGALRAGMSFSVALRFPGEQYPTVNPLAILWSADGSYVWKYDDGKAARVPAEIVQRNSDGVLVRGDLAPGDAIITEGILQLSDGASVTLLDGPDGTEAAADAAVTEE